MIRWSTRPAGTVAAGDRTRRSVRMPMIVSNLQSLRPLVAVVSLKRATIRPHPGALGPISTRPTGPAVVCRMRMPKWAAQRRSHAATRQTDARLTTDAKWILDLGPGYVVLCATRPLEESGSCEHPVPSPLCIGAPRELALRPAAAAA